MWHMFGNYGYLDGGWGIFMGVFMMIVPILFILLLVWLIYAVVSKGEGSRPDKDDGEKIARERYAKGEISKEKYEEMLKNLRK
ncbi:hypothetical protein C4544_01105 [candidate division WS5 bacterium]|uniref:SHOCT domain-containing protein n=1 Tax=candidate division WS5 bacterium TaxID=2093353 RepID=A0A419DGB8_9BACT|nr:MAG: hypothetical protein C4544_01105 [candidate division WS5 bacterium]